MKNERQVAFTPSSNNIFADLGLPNPESRRMKTQLVVAIREAMELRGLSQIRLAALAQTTQPRISRICNCDVNGISNDALLRVLGAMGYDVNISIVERGEERIAYEDELPQKAIAAYSRPKVSLRKKGSATRNTPRRVSKKTFA